jgi:hypothetical protein
MMSNQKENKFEINLAFRHSAQIYFKKDKSVHRNALMMTMD